MLILQFIIVQTIVFAVVFFILRRLMLKNTTSAVNRLKFVDEENAQRLEEMKKKIAEAEIEHKRKIAELSTELEKLREEARKQAEEEKNKLLARAKEEGERILGAARSRAEKIDQETEKELQTRVATLSGRVVQEVLSGQMKDSLNDQLIDELMQELQTFDTGHVPDQMKEVEIVIPRPLQPDHKKKIKEILEKKIGRKIEIRETVKKDMAGGLILHLGSLVVDGSLDNVVDGIVLGLKKQK